LCDRYLQAGAVQVAFYFSSPSLSVKRDMKILIVMVFCLLLAGCKSAPFKGGELYLNEKTSVGMGDFGVAKVRNQF
jgi:hypothetical protein